MELVIPEGTEVHITIGRAPAFPPADATAPERPTVPPGRPLLKGALATVLLCGAFVAGQHLSGRSSAAGPLQGALATTGHPEVEQYRPPMPLPEKPAYAALPTIPATPGAPSNRPSQGPAATHSQAEIPPAFRQQLAAPPQVSPPPGQPAPSATGGAPSNPFGLQE
ncbi:MAG: hypothetical protein J0H14_06975 [Alphaproteobacteria bacterium]|nr:hypothetical protein [Alphaproteobacteria bacterium]